MTALRDNFDASAGVSRATFQKFNFNWMRFVVDVFDTSNYFSGVILKSGSEFSESKFHYGIKFSLLNQIWLSKLLNRLNS